MSKKGKGKGKKGDEELEEEIRLNLKFDIENLENNIHLEKVRELEAINDYNKLLEGTKLDEEEKTKKNAEDETEEKLDENEENDPSMLIMSNIPIHN